MFYQKLLLKGFNSIKLRQQDEVDALCSSDWLIRPAIPIRCPLPMGFGVKLNHFQ